MKFKKRKKRHFTVKSRWTILGPKQGILSMHTGTTKHILKMTETLPFDRKKLFLYSKEYYKKLRKMKRLLEKTVISKPLKHKIPLQDTSTNIIVHKKELTQ